VSRRRRGALRAVLLARVSTHKRSQDASNPRQLSDLRDVARRRGWTVVAKYSDRVSGAETGPGLRSALDLIFRAKADLLVVCALDRLGRDVREMLQNVDIIRSAGGHFFVREDEIDTSSPEGRMQFTLLAALAEFQRRSNRFKIYAGLDHARKKGVRLGRPRKFGGKALARAVQLRRARPYGRILSWSQIRKALASEGLGTFKDPTIAGAVVRELARAKGSRSVDRTKHAPRKTPSKPGRGNTGKNGVASLAERPQRIT